MSCQPAALCRSKYSKMITLLPCGNFCTVSISVRVTQIHKCISYLLTPLHFTLNINLKKELNAQKTNCASWEDWTPDPWFTRPVLYHWAKEADVTIVTITNIYFKVGISLGTTFTYPVGKWLYISSVRNFMITCKSKRISRKESPEQGLEPWTVRLKA